MIETSVEYNFHYVSSRYDPVTALKLYIKAGVVIR